MDEDEEAPQYLIALSHRDKVLKLHRADGCHPARNRAFRSYEMCAIDPPPAHLWTSYCRTCWPHSEPPKEDEAEPDDADTESTSTEEDL